MRLRQVALVALDLEPIAEQLCDVFAIGAPYRDPGVAVFGLHNVVLPFADTFLEVVAPLRGDTAAGRYRARQGGDGGYMLLLQTEDLEAQRERVRERGVREVWSADLPDIRAVHLHPRDTGGALLSLDQPNPPGEWRWAGPAWRERGSALAGAIAAVEIASPDAEALARRWSDLLGQPLRRDGAGWSLALEPGQIRFRGAARDGRERLTGIDIAGGDAAEICARARRRGLPVDGRDLEIGGARLRLV